MTERGDTWASTMGGTGTSVVRAHAQPGPSFGEARLHGREAREAAEESLLAPGATRARGAGDRAREEEPDPERTCFERDRDRILHSPAFRRLAGKTQVFVHPRDHQRTRLTHALEVAQVATSVARSLGLNVALTEAIALGHDCGHGPGGHASEDAFDAFRSSMHAPHDHAVFGADVVLAHLNLCDQTLDGIRNHSWSRPTPSTPEGEVVSWADRIAYTAHDLEDAVDAGVVLLSELPDEVTQVIGSRRGQQLGALIAALVSCSAEEGSVAMRAEPAGALAALRRFNYDHIYTRRESRAQAEDVIAVLRALVEHSAQRPWILPADLGTGLERGSDEAVRAAVTWVAGMTDRYAFETAVVELGWDPARLPRGVDVPRRG